MKIETRWTTTGKVDNDRYNIGNVPATFKRSTEITAWNVDLDTGLSSAPSIFNIKVVPEDQYTRKLLMAHDMLTLSRFRPDKAGTLRFVKNRFGINANWIHLENIGELQYLPEMIAAHEEAEMPFIVGMAFGGGVGDTKAIMQLYLNSPMGLRWGGKPILSGYVVSPATQEYRIQEMKDLGYDRDDFLDISNRLYPFADGGAAIVSGEQLYKYGKFPDYGTRSSPGDPEDVRYLARNLEVDGFLGFMDQGANTIITDVANEMGKVAIVTDIALYESIWHLEAGFPALIQNGFDVIKPKPKDRAQGKATITANDGTESSYTFPLPFNTVKDEPYSEGLGFWAPFGLGWNHGEHTLHPAPEHTGFLDGIKPLNDAFLNNQEDIIITEYKIFYSHPLHAKEAQPRIKAPKLWTDFDPQLAKFWGNTSYADPYKIRDDGNAQFPQAQTALLNMRNEIVMVAHSPKDFQMEINGVRSEVKKAGIGLHIVPFDKTFRGNPTFAIVVNGRRVAQDISVQPIRPLDIFPGRGIPIAYAAKLNGLVIPAKPVLKYSNGLLTATSKLAMQYMYDHAPWKDYFEPIKITESLPADAIIIRVKATDTNNASASAMSPEIKVK